MGFQNALPRAVTTQLGQLRTKLKQVVVLRGVGLFLVIGSMSLVGMMLADWAFDLEPQTRRLLLAAWVIELVGLAGWCVVRPMCRTIDDVELAAFAERLFPSLGERLVTLIELNDESVPESQRGSSLMREMLAFQTTKRVAHLDFEQAVSTVPALRSFSTGICIVALIGLSVLLFPAVTGTLVARLLNPWGNYQSISLVDFEVGDEQRVVPRGSDVRIAPKIRWKSGSDESIPEPVTVEMRMASGEVESRELRFDPDLAAFVTTVPKVFESFDFIVSAANGRSKRFAVKVVDAPVVSTAKLEITPPGYIGEPRRVVDGVVGDVSVFERSQLKFEITFNKPMKSAEMQWFSPLVVSGTSHDPRPATKEPVQRRVGPVTNELISVRNIPATPMTLSSDGLRATVELPAEVQGTFEFRLHDEFGLTNSEPQRQFLVTLDQPPHIEMPGAPRDEARPTDVFPIAVDVRDDFAIGSLELHVTSNSGLQHVVPVDRAMLGTNSLQHEFRVDIADLDVRVGDILTLQVRATDERPTPAPNEVWSAERVVAIKADASAPGTKEVLARQDEIRKEIASLKQELAKEALQAKELGSAAQKAATADKPFDERKEIEPLADAELAAAERLKELATRFNEHPLFANLAPETRQLAEKNVEAAANNLELAATEEPAEVAKELGTNAEKLTAASERLGEMQKRFDELAKLERDLLDVTRLAQRANQLADDATKLEEKRQELAQQKQLAGDAPDAQQAARDELNREQQALQQEQQELLNNLNDLFEKRPELLEAARDHQLDQLVDLADQLRKLAEPQEQLAKAVEENAQKAAEANQPLAQRQQELAQQAEKLAAQTDQQQARQPVAPLDPDVARQIADELKKGNVEAAERLAGEAADDLERLAKELQSSQPLPAEPKAAAKELARRQRELAEAIESAAAQVARADQDKPQAADPAASGEAQSSDPKSPKPESSKPNDASRETRQLAARQAALEMAAAQLNLDRESRDEQQAAVDRAADTVRELVSAAREADRAAESQEQAANPATNPATDPAINKDASAQQAARLEWDAQAVSKQLERAAEEAREAAAALDRLSEVAQMNSEAPKDAQPAARSAQEAAQQLAQQQRDLRAQTEKLQAEQSQAALASAPMPATGSQPQAQPQPPTPPTTKPDGTKADATKPDTAKPDGVPAPATPAQQAATDAARDVANQQQALREQAEQLPNDVGALPRAEAIERLAAAEEALESGRLNDAATAQRQAEEALDQFARLAAARAEQPQNSDPSSPEQLAQEARRLASEQRDLQNALASSNPPRSADPAANTDQPPANTAPNSPAQNPMGQTPAAQPSAAQLAQRQDDLTAQAAELAIQAAQQAGPESPAAQEARRSVERSEQSENSTRNGQFARASESAQQAGQAAQQAADALRQNSPTLADRAEQIAQQQQQVAAALSQLDQNPTAQAAAQREQQQSLSDRATALQESLNELAQQLGSAPLNLDQPSQRANQAGQTTQQSRQAMQQANSGLQEGNRGDAAQSGRQAAESLRQAADQAAALQRPQSSPNNPVPGEFANELAQAAQRLQQAQQQIADALQSTDSSPAPSGNQQAASPMPNQNQSEQGSNTPMNGQPGQASNDQAQNGGQQNSQRPNSEQTGTSPQGQGTAPQASGNASPGNSLASTADSLRQAANSLNQVASQLQSNANQANGEQNGPGIPNQQAAANGLPNSGVGAAATGPGGEVKTPTTGLEKQAMRNWGKLPGTLKTEILQSSQRKANGDYAKQIKLYFEELAKSGEQPTSK